MTETQELTIIKTARTLGVTLDAVYRQVYAGRLPARKFRGRWLIPRAAVQARLQRRKASRAKNGRNYAA